MLVSRLSIARMIDVRQIFVRGISSDDKTTNEKKKKKKRSERERGGEGEGEGEGERERESAHAREKQTVNISDRLARSAVAYLLKPCSRKAAGPVGNGINLSMRTVHPFNIHHAFITAEAIRRLFSRHAVFSSLSLSRSSFGRRSFLSIGDSRGWLFVAGFLPTYTREQASEFSRGHETR